MTRTSTSDRRSEHESGDVRLSPCRNTRTVGGCPSEILGLAASMLGVLGEQLVIDLSVETNSKSGEESGLRRISSSDVKEKAIAQSLSRI